MSKEKLPVCKFCGGECLKYFDDTLREAWQCSNRLLCPVRAMTCYTEEAWRTIMSGE